MGISGIDQKPNLVNDYMTISIFDFFSKIFFFIFQFGTLKTPQKVDPPGVPDYSTAKSKSKLP